MAVPTSFLSRAAAYAGRHLFRAGAFGAMATGAALGTTVACADATERSFIMLKPDAVQRGLVGEIIQRFEKRGYKLVGLKQVTPTLDMAKRHYHDLAARPFFPALTEFLSSGPVVAMVWEGEDVVKQGRAMIGATNPLASAPGTIRGDLAIVTGKNIIHGSDSVETAKAEIELWFDNKELNNYTANAATWIYEGK